jgi:hypothetical protein
MWREETFDQPWRDPIVEEIRKVREEHAARFNYNVRAIVEDARRRQQEGGRKVVSLPPRRLPIADKPAS